jgi:hypothetical protein
MRLMLVNRSDEFSRRHVDFQIDDVKARSTPHHKLGQSRKISYNVPAAK